MVSCYAAGRDCFWVRRSLLHRGGDNIVVDSESTEVRRRKRRARSGRLDAVRLAGRHPSIDGLEYSLLAERTG